MHHRDTLRGEPRRKEKEAGNEISSSLERIESLYTLSRSVHDLQCGFSQAGPAPIAKIHEIIPLDLGKKIQNGILFGAENTYI